YRALGEAAGHGPFEPARRRHIENALRDFRLSGVELPPSQRVRFKDIEDELAQLAARIEDNVLDATNDFALYVDDAAELDGVPADVLAAAAEASAADGRSGWKLTLHMPCYLPVLQHAARRELRQTLYRALAIRASELGNPEWDNTPLIRRILDLRQELA